MRGAANRKKRAFLRPRIHPPPNDKGPNCGVRVPPPPWVLIWGEGRRYTLLFDWGGKDKLDFSFLQERGLEYVSQ